MIYLIKDGWISEYPYPSGNDWEEYGRKYGRLAERYIVPHIKNPQKSDKVEGIIPILESLELEVKVKALPPTYHYWPISTWQNTKIRVDHIPKSAAACWSIAIWALVGATGRRLELYFEDESKSNFYAFITFSDHDYATRFVEKLNNKQIPGTDMVYQLSWAPFYRNLSILAEDEKKRGKAKEGKPYMYVVEEFVRQLPVDHAMLSKIRAFHRRLIKEAVVDSKALWKCGIFDRQGVIHGPDDGRTTILCLTMVDPFVKESHMKSIFEQYGECTVNLADKEGCGLVKFEQRLCAENAFADLATLLKDGNVCCLRWGLDREERCRRFKKYGFRGLEREGLSPLHGEKNNREEKAIAMEETSKRPIVGAKTSKRPTAAEMSKRLIVGAETSKRPTAAETSKRPIVGAETSKRPTAGAEMSKRPIVGAETSKRPIVAAGTSKRPIVGAETSKRPTAAETSKRFQSVGKSASKTKATRGRTRC